MAKKWSLRPAITKQAEKKLAPLPELVAKLLYNRGITDIDEADPFLNPDYEKHIHDPFLMTDMDKAVERILLAIKNNEKIVIFGDYDADGVPGTAILATFFKQVGFINFVPYIPDRHLESYGLNLIQVDKFAADGVKLIITIDCGITAFAESVKARELGVDVIITDHHLPHEILPEALAIVDPKREGDVYPNKNLCGAGVAFKLVQGLIARGGFDIVPGWEKWLLDLVAVSTVSDMVPLVGENRVLVNFGLRVLNKTRRPGLLALVHVLKLKLGVIAEDDIGFMIGPRINSASRMTHGSEAYELLTTDSDSVARTIATNLEKNNKQRKVLVETIMQTVTDHFAHKEVAPVVVVGDPSWGLGVLGLASARITEKYNRVSFVWGKNGDGLIKGSCRSDGSVNLVELMMAAGGRDFFNDMGGHIHAGGFSLAPEKEDELENRLIEAYGKLPKEEVVIEQMIDSELDLSEVTWDTFKEVDRLSPFGIDNPKPVFLFRDIEIGGVKTFGNGGIHIELSFQVNGKKLVAIGFFGCPPVLDESEEFDGHNGHNFPDVALISGHRIDLLANLEKSNFKNYPELRLRIVDIRSVV
ncbi:MAG: single-stranded-DNA-specific exonuclease RecJ [Candidatus Vogelbacteria bacterium]|nr:single-stranded-DNA-specific exonuclease RecJ [Candidatus Vogelbacteria bacterium]